MEVEMDVGMPGMNCSNCSMHMDNMPMMAVAFFFGFQKPLLFSSFNLETPGKLLGGIILILVVAILYEGLKTVREILATLEAKRSAKKVLVNADSERTPLLPAGRYTKHEGPELLLFLRHVVKEYCSPLHFLQSCLQVVQVGVAYLLMLVAMTFNGWLFLAVCIGAGLGYFIFGKCRKSYGDFRAQSEHCH